MKIDIDNVTAARSGGMDMSYTVKAHVDGELRHMVIAVDWEALAVMLARACFRNKTGKTRIASGNIRGWVKR